MCSNNLKIIDCYNRKIRFRRIKSFALQTFTMTLSDTTGGDRYYYLSLRSVHIDNTETYIIVSWAISNIYNTLFIAIKSRIHFCNIPKYYLTLSINYFISIIFSNIT